MYAVPLSPPSTASSRKIWSLNNGGLEIGEILGQGKFGKVFRVQHTASKFTLALKSINKKNIDKISELEKHWKRQKALRHEGILRVYGYFFDKENVYAMLQYAQKGTLREFLEVKGKLEEEKAAGFLKQVIKAVQYLHSKNIVHTQIKPENILMQNEGHLLVKLPSYFSSKLKSTTDQGGIQLNYTASEIVGGLQYDESADIWSIGVLMFEMVCGSQILDQEEAPNFVIPSHVSTNALDLFPKLIVRNPERRAPLQAVLAHPWVKNNAVKRRSQKETVQRSDDSSSLPSSDPVVPRPLQPPAPSLPNVQPRRTFGKSLENKRNH